MFKGSTQAEKCSPCPSIWERDKIEVQHENKPYKQNWKKKDPIKWHGTQSSNKVPESGKMWQRGDILHSWPPVKVLNQHQEFLLGHWCGCKPQLLTKDSGERHPQGFQGQNTHWDPRNFTAFQLLFSKFASHWNHQRNFWNLPKSCSPGNLGMECWQEHLWKTLGVQ